MLELPQRIPSDTTPVIIGVINHPVSGALIFDPTSFDPTTDILDQNTIIAINAAIQAAGNNALNGIAYVSDGVKNATTVFGGDGEDLFNVYHNKGPLRLEGEAGNDEFIVRAFVTVDLSVQADTEIDGGAGADIINYAINAPVSLDGGAGFDTVVVLGTPFNDSFVGTSDGIFGAGLNVTFANVESAELDALEGNDTIYVLGTSSEIVTTVIGGLGDDVTSIISDDLLGRSGLITHGLTSLDNDFDNVGVNGVGLNVLSVAGLSPVRIQPTGEPLLVAEDGLTLASYFISLVTPNAAALADNPVYLTVSAGVASSKDRSNGGASILVSVNGGAFTNAVVLTFDGTTASTEFTITVKAIDDLGEEGPRLALISHSINSGDVAFNDLPLIDIFVDVVDNDKGALDIRNLRELAGVGFVPDNSTAVLEGGAPFGFDDVYSVALTTAPAVGEIVTVTLNTDAQISALSGAAPVLVFNDTNWMIPQLVVVTAFEDGLDGIEISTITHEISSIINGIAGGGIYGVIPSTEYPELDVTVYDDETPGAIVQETDGSTLVVDGGANDTYRVRLTRLPADTVTLTLRTDTQTKLSSTSVGFSITDESGVDGFFEYTFNFTGTNWYQWVDIEVSANPDFVPGTNDHAKAFAPQDQNLDQIRGPLIIEGGVGEGTPRGLEPPVLLPGETNSVSEQIPASTTEAGDIDTLNVFHTDNNDADTGDLFYRTLDAFGNVIANPGLALTGFEMGDDAVFEEGTPEAPEAVYYGGGITLNGFEKVEILLGKGDESLDVADTGDRDEKAATVVGDPATITAIHGGGGNDTIKISGRGKGPLVVYGDTSENRVRYSNDAPVGSIHGTSFSNDGNDTIDAPSMADQNDGFVGLVAYGGFGNDTILGSQGDDHLAGGTSREAGRDFIDGQAGNDHIYGDSHFNVDLQLFSEDQVQAFDGTDPLRQVADIFRVLDATVGDDNDFGSADYRESAGADEIWGGDGSDIIFGDHGVITLAEGTRRLTTTASVVRIDTVQPTFGGDDTIYGHSNEVVPQVDDGASDRIFGGQGGDYIDAGNGNNVVLGDHGFINLGVADSAIDRIESTETTFAGGADTILTGLGNGIVVGGRFGDNITVADGTNIVLGDAGFIQYQAGGPLVGEVSSVYLDGSGTFIQGGNDTISVGVGANTGNDIVIAGLGDDTVTIGNGNNIVFGDDGSVTFQTGSNLRDRIESRYLNGADFAALDGTGAVVGNDTITTGVGNDTILGGLGNDGITVTAGNNTVLSDEGFIQYQDQGQTGGTSVLGEISSLYMDLAGTFLQGGIDTISVGVGVTGNDVVIGGLGDDGITIGNGDNVVLGDDGGITYQTGSGLRNLITSRYLDAAGFAALDATEAVVGNDTISTGSGNDVVIGGLGNDGITVTAGNNTVVGDEGFIQYQGQGQTGGTSVLGENSSLYMDLAGTFLQGGIDTISTDSGNDVVIAGLGDDGITIGNGNNVVLGDDGGITYQTGSGLRNLITTRYLDTAGFAALDATEAGVGNDTISTGVGNDVILGGLGGDTITVEDGSNIVTGDEGFVQYQAGIAVLGEVSSLYLDLAGTFLQGGNDTISVGVGANTGDDTVIAGLGDDTVTIGNGDNIVIGDDGGITYQAGSGLRDLITTRYLDTAGFAALDATEAGVGNDTIITGTGNDVILGGLGIDTITVADGNNIVTGDEGFVQYQDQNDTGNTSVLGEVSSAYLAVEGTFLQGGNDTITLGASAGSNGLGSDIVIAGLGDDGITIGNGDNVVLGDDGGITYQTGSGLRNLITTRYLDAVVGIPGRSALNAPEAEVGNDTIITGTGNDVILGGLGDDTITVEDGSNIVAGDEGFVRYQIGSAFVDEVSSLYLDGSGTFIQGGNDTISVGVGANTGDDVVVAGLGDDTVTIGNGNNIAFGDEGRVTYQAGGSLRDLIESQYLDDFGFAALDVDPLEAVVGNDTISTGIGDDVILGGLGDDTITVEDGSNVVLGDEGFVQYQAGIAVLGVVSSLYLDGHGNFIQGGDDTISVGVGANTGDDVVIGSLGADVITIGNGNNIALGDEGAITYQAVSGLWGWIESRYLDALGRSPLEAPEAEVGDDMITTGTGDDVAIGGLGDDMIDVSEGDNIVLGDEGDVHYQEPLPDVGEITTKFTDGDGDFVQGGDDKITTGGGTDYILSGSGSDTVNAGGGDDMIFGDGLIEFHPGTSVPETIVSASQDDNFVLLPPSDAVYFAGGGNDIVIGNSGNDWIEGGTGDDILIGDEAVITFDPGRALDPIDSEAVPDFIQTVFFTPDGQLLPGGTDVLLGQNDDDIVIGGSFNDMLDGGSGRDMVFGNNVTLDRTGARLGVHTNPRFRTLTGEEIYATGLSELGELLIDRVNEYGDPNWAGLAPFWGDFVITVHDGMTTWDGLVDLDPVLQDALNRTWGNNFIAGGSEDDTIFGQRGEDTIHGDGSVFFDVWNAGRLFADGLQPSGALIDAEAAGLDNDPLALWDLLNASRTQSWNGGSPIDTPRSYEAVDDGDDYIEGGLDDDVIFGNLGQNDIIGGNSNLFGLTASVQRTSSGENMIFGGAGTRTGRSDPGFNVDPLAVPDGQVFLSEADSHARNASVILGDNGNIFRIVGTNGLNTGTPHFNYDRARHLDPDNALLVDVRGVDLLDYQRWQAALDHGMVPPDHLGFDAVIGGSDLIRGESGEDRIWGMGGDNAIFGDGVVLTSRNNTTVSESLHGIGALAAVNVEISTPGNLQSAIIDVDGELKHTAQLYFFNHGGNDIVYGGLGDDSIHSGWGDDAVSGAEALPEYYNGELNDLLRAQQGPTAKAPAWYDAIAPVNPGNILQFDPAKGEFALYDEFDPWRKIMVNAQGEATGGPDALFEFFLNFDETEGPAVTDPNWGTVNTDGNDRIFGDSGNDWIVEGTGRGHVYGGMGDDLLNLDDNLNSTAGTPDTLANNVPDTHPSYEDITYGGAGRDILIGNTGGDRMMDWVGEFNSFIVPFAPFGAFAISRALAPQIGEYLLELARSDGSDQWLPDWERFADEFDADPTIDAPSAARNYEPYGELGMIRQQDPGWSDQTGAPADPQPGNIPGGSRDVLRSADFNDGSMDGFAPDSGTFAVEAGALDVSAESLGGDAVSVYHVDQQLPAYFEISAFVKTEKAIGGWNANAYIIFDYQSPTDFKFAGIDDSTNKIQMGHRAESGWVVDVQTNIQIKPDQYYHVLVAVNGTTVTVVVDNQDVFSHAFEPRVENGWAYNLNWGYVGVGSNNARGTFENVEVRVLPPDFTLEQTEDFTSSAGLFTGLPSGTWQVGGGRYDVTSGVGTGLSLIDLGLGHGLTTASLLDLSTTMNTSSVGGFVFDVYEEEFKFVALDAVNDQLLIGHHTAKSGWVVDTAVSVNIDAGVDYELSASLKGTTVSASLTVPGEQAPIALVGHVFNSAVVDGGFGLLGNGGNSSFDTMTFRTDDPSFAS